MSTRKRDTGPKLTKAEKDDRDARATYWMNQRKIERVAEGAARHGWFRLPEDAMLGTPITLDAHDDYVFDYQGHTYRYEGEENGEVIARRIA